MVKGESLYKGKEREMDKREKLMKGGFAFLETVLLKTIQTKEGEKEKTKQPRLKPWGN